MLSLVLTFVLIVIQKNSGISIKKRVENGRLFEVGLALDPLIKTFKVHKKAPDILK